MSYVELPTVLLAYGLEGPSASRPVDNSQPQRGSLKKPANSVLRNGATSITVPPAPTFGVRTVPQPLKPNLSIQGGTPKQAGKRVRLTVSNIILMVQDMGGETPTRSTRSTKWFGRVSHPA